MAIKTNFIRTRVSPLVTNTTARLGFANRSQFIRNLHSLGIDNEQLLLDELDLKGVLKHRFRGQIGSLGELQPFMLTSALTMNKINSLDITTLEIKSLYADQSKTMNTLVNGAKAGFETLGRGLTALDDSEIVPKLAFGLGAGAALAISGSLLFPGIPLLTWGLATSTGLGIASAKYADKLPPHDLTTKALSFMASKVLPLSVIGLSGNLASLVYDANMNIAGIFETIGIKGSILFGLSLLWTLNSSLRKHLKEFRESYPAQLDPGSFRGMKKLVSLTAYSIFADTQYLAVRGLLLGAASFFLAIKMVGAFGIFATMPFAAPVVFFIGTPIIRKYLSSEVGNEKLSKTLDHLKAYLPVYGFGVGFASSAVAALAVSSIIPPLAFTILWGSLGTFIFAETHGAGHAINTNKGGLCSLKTSSVDLIGEKKIGLLSRGLQILALNPHTGMKEHTLGFLFTCLGCTKPGLSLLTTFDYIIQQEKNLKDYKADKDFIAWTNTLMADITERVDHGLKDAGSIEKEYQTLIRNLEALADYYENELADVIKDKMKTNSSWFVEDVEEFQRAGFQTLLTRAEKFRSDAQKLKDELEILRGSDASQDHPGWQLAFDQHWLYQAGCFDPDLVVKISSARKEMRGDDWKARKVENVATYVLFRGLIPYKIWRLKEEKTNIHSGYPPVDIVWGTWTMIRNPFYKRGAKTGSHKASKYLYIKSKEVIVPLQEKKQAHLSTSSLVRQMDNTPDESEGFTKGTIPLTFSINRENKTISEYFFVSEGEQFKIPKVKKALLREDTPQNQQELEENYSIGTIDTLPFEELEPAAFYVPLFDYTLMMDKNDIQVNTYTVEPTILERERENIVANLIYRYPFGGSFKFRNPHTKKEIDQKHGIDIVDANIELTFQGRTIPFLIDRTFVRTGRNGDVDWQSLKGAVRRIGTVVKSKIPADQFDKVAHLFADPKANNLVFKPNITEGEINKCAVPETTKAILQQARINSEDGSAHFSLIYNKNADTRKIFLPSGLNIPNLEHLPSNPASDKDIVLDASAITAGPQKWLRVTYKDDSVRFIQLPDAPVKDNPKPKKGFSTINRGRTIKIGRAEYSNPCPDREVVDISIEPGNIALTRPDDKKSKQPVPLLFDDTAIAETMKKNGLENATINKIIISSGGKVTLVYKGLVEGDFEVELPPDAHPGFLSSLELPQSPEVMLEANPFTKLPQREGDRAWYRIHYTDGTQSFVRVPDGKRPILFNKDRGMISGELAGNAFFNKITVKGGMIEVSDLHIPIGMPVKLMPGWNQGLEEGQKIEAVDNSGNIYIGADGQFYPTPPKNQDATKIKKGSIIGRVFIDDNGKQDAGVVDLGRYRTLNQVAHVESTIEIIPDKEDENKLVVIERRMLTHGLWEDRSANIYNINPETASAIEKAIPNLEWIRDVNISPDGNQVVITFTTPDNAEHTLTLNGKDLTDNFGKALLNNKRVRLTVTDDIYQSSAYTPETEKFRPHIDYYNGSLRLIVHGVNRYKIDKPETLKTKGKNFKIFPSTAVGALQINGKWQPLTLDKPLDRLDLLHAGKEGFSAISKGEIKSVIGPQMRLGAGKNMSLDYPRDDDFYGLDRKALAFLRDKYGSNLGINRGKALRASRGIQSGRTHMMPWELIFNEFFADLMETNSEFARKLSNYAHWLWGPGVSEDTQMEVVAWLMGVRMHVLKQMVALMAAEKNWGSYKIQNTERYCRSESLFVNPFKIVLHNIFFGKVAKNLPNFFNWGAISEISAGRTWYKVPFSKLFELTSIPVFLSLIGHALWFPVDLVFFLMAWSFRTIFSSAAYLHRLTSIGYGAASKIGHDVVNNMNYTNFTKFIRNPARNIKNYFSTGLWNNVSFELSFLYGYAKDSFWQHVHLSQFGSFVTTVSGKKEKVPRANRRLLGTIAGFIGTGIAIGSAALFLGGFGQLAGFALAFAICANFFFGLYGLGLILNALALMKRERLDPAEYKKMEDFEDEHPHYNARFLEILREFGKKRTELSYNQLFLNIEELKIMLTHIESLDSAGRIDVGFHNPWRNVANAIIEAYTSAEMFVCIKAIQDLKQDSNNNEARLALKKLLRESREYMVIHSAYKLYRGLGLKL